MSSCVIAIYSSCLDGHLRLRRGYLCKRKPQVNGGITLVLREDTVAVTGLAVLILLTDDLVIFDVSFFMEPCYL